MTNFWETPEWILGKIKPIDLTDVVITKVQYVKMFGAKNFTEEKYQAYLKAMEQKLKETENDSI